MENSIFYHIQKFYSANLQSQNTILGDLIIDNFFESLGQVILLQNELVSLLTSWTGSQIQQVDILRVNLAGLAKSSSCRVTAHGAKDEFERPHTDAGILVWLVILKNIPLSDGLLLHGFFLGSRATLEHNWRLPGEGRWFDGGCILIPGGYLLVGDGHLQALVVVQDTIVIHRDISFLIVSFEWMKDFLAGAAGLGNNLQQHFLAVDWRTRICREHLDSSDLSFIVNIDSDPKGFCVEHCQFVHDFLHTRISCGILLDAVIPARS